MIWTTRQRFKTDNGLAVSACGEGPPLVLLHGVGLRSGAWCNLCNALSNDFSIQAIDLPGHGDSEDLDINAPKLRDYSNSIATYLKTLQAPVYLAGHSMGAMMALDIATRFPTLITHIAALNAIYSRSEDASKAVQRRAKTLKGVAQNDLNTDVTLARWFGGTPSGALLEAAQSCKTWLHETPITQYHQAYEVFAHHDGPSSAQLSNLKMPALFITGANEPNSTPEMSRRMAELAPKGIATIIGGAAHMMPMTHASEVAIALIDHFKG